MKLLSLPPPPQRGASTIPLTSLGISLPTQVEPHNPWSFEAGFFHLAPGCLLMFSCYSPPSSAYSSHMGLLPVFRPPRIHLLCPSMACSKSIHPTETTSISLPGHAFANAKGWGARNEPQWSSLHHRQESESSADKP